MGATEQTAGPLQAILDNYRNPQVGDRVHYVSHGTPVREDGTQAFTSQCRAATVTERGEERGLLGLCVFNPTGLFFHPLSDGGATHSHRREGGTWHWPATYCQ